jgi:hypothetical protein
MRGLTIERTTAILLFALIFALAARTPVDTDTWWHLRSADHILTDGFIYSDPFSLTMQGEAWINHSWGAQVIMLAFWRVGTYFGLTVYMAILATLGMFMVYRTAAVMGATSVYVRAFALVIGATAAAVFWSARPQMLSFALSGVTLYLLALYKYRGVDRLWWFVPMMALWGNLHAGFSIGFIFIGGVIGGEIIGNVIAPKAEYALGWRRVGRLIVVGLLSAAALAINPYGLQMWLVPFQTVGIGALRSFIQEWNSPNFQERQTWGFILLLFGTLGALGASRRALPWTDFALLSGTGFLALAAGRNISVFAIVATPIFAVHLDAALRERGWVVRAVRRPSRLMRTANALIVGVVIVGAAAKTVLVIDPRVVDAEMARVLPVDALNTLMDSSLSDARLFNSYNWGGYLMFARPDARVFVDGRTDLYGDALLTRYLRTATGGDGWRETLDEYAINLVIVETGSGLARRLADEPGWNMTHQDDLAMIFRR